MIVTGRARHSDAPLANQPYIRIEDKLTGGRWAQLRLEAGRHWALGLAAVIEELDGTISYWALAHGADQRTSRPGLLHTPARLGGFR